MLTLEELEHTQGTAFRTVFNSSFTGRTSHAYLIAGEKGTPVFDFAKFVAQTFLCEDPRPIACQKCNNCHRVDNETYTDLTIVNKDGGAILKDDIVQLMDDFTLTALEPKGIKVYIIHLIENANITAINRLLKFLEDPSNDIIAILTTENIAKVLPTIISRCQLIRLKNPDKNVLFGEINNVVKDESLAYLLSCIYPNKDKAIEAWEDKNFKTIELLAEQAKDCIVDNPNELSFMFMNKVVPVCKSSKDVYLFLEILGFLLKECVFANEENNRIERITEVILKEQGKLSLNVNPSLLLDGLSYKIRKEK